MSETPQETLERLLDQRILIIAGPMGTMVQGYELSEEDYRGERFPDHPANLKGNTDILTLSRPDIVEEIHHGFLEAGADIIETNTFNAQKVSQGEYQTTDLVHEMNVAATRIARRAADSFTARNPEKPRFVAGSLGPTNRTLSISPDVNDPALRAITFDQLKDAYREQALALLDGGVDILLPETTFDTLNLKAAIAALEEAFEEFGRRVPVMLSLTITDRSGRVLSGQTLEAAWISVAHAKPLSIGLNCALGANEMRPYVEALSNIAPVRMSCYPNAGLPNAFGQYDEQPSDTAATLHEFAEAGWLNIAGGCCGTTPEHIRAISEALAGMPPRQPPAPPANSFFSGLEPLEMRPDSNFMVIGERTNVSGSRKFLRLIKKGDFESALSVALDQVRGGANILDVNMDEGMLDSEEAMTHFLNLVATEPEIARIPIMVDSSKLVGDRGRPQVRPGQGASPTRSVSRRARTPSRTRRDSSGATARAWWSWPSTRAVKRSTPSARCRSASAPTRSSPKTWASTPVRSSSIPTSWRSPPASRSTTTTRKSFIEATRRIKELCPGAKVSGGVSNLSFSFRGNEHRCAKRCTPAFLYHAISRYGHGHRQRRSAGVYEDIPKDLLEHVEDVIFNRREDATERLVEFAETVANKGKAARSEHDARWREDTVEKRLSHALVTASSTSSSRTT